MFWRPNILIWSTVGFGDFFFFIKYHASVLKPDVYPTHISVFWISRVVLWFFSLFLLLFFSFDLKKNEIWVQMTFALTPMRNLWVKIENVQSKNSEKNKS
jgi:hypothetical protein